MVTGVVRAAQAKKVSVLQARAFVCFSSGILSILSGTSIPMLYNLG